MGTGLSFAHPTKVLRHRLFEYLPSLGQTTWKRVADARSQFAFLALANAMQQKNSTNPIGYACTHQPDP